MSKSTAELRKRVASWRESRKRLHRYRWRIQEALNAADAMEEGACNEEYAIALRLLQSGPVEVDGRRFSFEMRDGCPSVRVDPARSNAGGFSCFA